MSQPSPTFTFASVTHIPRSMLWVVVIDTLLWCAAIPAAMAVRYGKPDWLSVAAMGIVFAPLVVLAIYIARLVLYFTVLIYWYLVGLRALITMAFGVGVIVLVLFFPINPPPVDPRQLTSLLPIQATPSAGAVMVVLALVAVFFLGRLSARKKAPPPAPPASAAARPMLDGAPITIQQQLQQRAQRLKKP